MVKLLRYSLSSLVILLAACAPAATTLTPTEPPAVRGAATPTPPAWQAASATLSVSTAPQLAYLGRLDASASVPSTLFAYALATDGGQLAGLNNDQVVAWNLATGQMVFTTARQAAEQIYYAPHSDALYTLDGSGLLRILSANTGAERGQFSVHAIYRAAAYSPQGQLAAGGEDSSVAVWDVAAQKQAAAFNAGSSAVNNLTFSPDGSHLALTTTSGQVQVWDWRAQQPVASLAVAARRLVFAPDGQTLALDMGREVRLWRYQTDDVVTLAVGGSGDVLLFAPDGQLIFASSPSALQVFAAPTGARLHNLPVTGQRTTAKFSPDGTLLVTAALDGAVTLWDAAQFTQVDLRQAVLEGASRSVLYADWSPSNQHLLLVDAYGSVQVWGVPKS